MRVRLQDMYICTIWSGRIATFSCHSLHMGRVYFIWRPHLNVYSRSTSKRVSTRLELSRAFNFKTRARSGSGIGRGPWGYAGCIALFLMPYANEKEDILHNWEGINFFFFKLKEIYLNIQIILFISNVSCVKKLH